MNRVLVLPLLLLALVLACDSTNPVAPDGVSLTISVSKTQIAISGETAVISVTGFRPDGNRLFPGTQITFSTNLGVISPAVEEIGSDGFARATLTGTGQQGMATVSVGTAGSAAGGGGDMGGAPTSGSINVTIGDDEFSRPLLTIIVSPAELDINEDAEVIVDIRNADGTPFSGTGEVTLTTSLGCFGDGGSDCPTETRRSVNGVSRIVVPFNSRDEVGTAIVRGLLGSAEAEAMVTIEVQRPELLVTVNPSIIPVGGRSEIQILARDVNGSPLGAIQRIRLVADLGTIQGVNGGGEIEAVSTDSNGEARARYVAGDRAGQGTVTATLGTSVPVMTSLTIRDAVGSLNLNPSTTSIARVSEGVEIVVAATVLNAQGDSIGGVLVTFGADVGAFSTPSGTSTTNPQGVASETLTVTLEDVRTIPENGTFRITASATSEGATAEDDVTIIVLGPPQ